MTMWRLATMCRRISEDPHRHHQQRLSRAWCAAWQEFFYDRNYAATPLLNPDFARLADAYGIKSATVSERSQVVPTVESARQHDGPMLINFRVEQEDTVYLWSRPARR